MKIMRAVVVLLLGAAVAAWAQEGPPLPKPGPEHELLKQSVGVWDATVEMFMAPGAAPTVSKGTETNRILGGFWLVSHFQSELMGQPFEGVGTSGWDPLKKKYVGTWVDSMSPGMSAMESTWDPATKTSTGWIEGPDLSGKVTKTRETEEWKDADTRVFTMYGPAGADGKEPVAMRISYKRRPAAPPK
ncbi:MAG: hypothetical protein A2V74_02670 [Acidobacteria bacterium RBG_16_70_10]|nr:MAG: hypothetical protein A2V74_02670 [Acidobacteria bacterium RBG_16_70_10]